MRNKELKIYFNDKILSNKEYYRINASSLVIDYLSDITSEFALSPELFNNEAETLFQLYKENKFKYLADYSLFMSGCFTESLLNRVNLFDYYITMSKLSYRSMCQEKIYSEIYNSFDDCLLMISGLSSNDNNDNKVYELYKLSKETGNYLIKKRLIRVGIHTEIEE